MSGISVEEKDSTNQSDDFFCVYVSLFALMWMIGLIVIFKEVDLGNIPILIALLSLYIIWEVTRMFFMFFFDYFLKKIK